MRVTQYLFVPWASDELMEEVQNKPTECLESPQVNLVRASSLGAAGENPRIPADAFSILSKKVAIACEYDPGTSVLDDIRHGLENVAISLQLVKPTPGFLEYWLAFDSAGRIIAWDAPISRADIDLPNLTNPLAYQQHHTVYPDDANTAIRLLPALSKAMAIDAHGSWAHPFGGIHRALILFCQGYTGSPDLAQLLWAAGLDCLFASKIDRRKWGAAVIGDRLRTFWGADFRPYDNVQIPVHQTRPNHRLTDVTRDIFRLRNAYIHGTPIPQAWLLPSTAELEAGYAYQLCECTEILLRMTLTKILSDPKLQEIFLDPTKLDSYL